MAEQQRAKPHTESNVLYLGIACGKFTHKVKEGTLGAVYRKYVNPKGEIFHMYEIIYENVQGLISKMEVSDGKYGPQLQLVINNSGDFTKVYINLKTKYFTTLMYRLPNIDLTTPVYLKPYDFVGDKGGQIAGITVMQDGSKLNNYYKDAVTNEWINLPESKKPYDKLTQLERDAFFANQTQFFVASIDLLSKNIPEANKGLMPTSIEDEKQDDFFDQAAAGDQPTL